MRRREFLGALGAAAVAPALLPARPAQAQKPAVRAIGFLSPTSLEANAENLRAIRQGLRESGFAEGENLEITYRFAENKVDRLPALASELVRRRVAVIMTHSTGASAAKGATKTIPVVFAVAEDPARTGLVTSLARPGGNLTGANFVSAELVAKRVELLRDLLPGAKRIGVLVNPAVARRAEATVNDVEIAARTLGLQVQAFNGGTSRDIVAAFASIANERIDALLVGNDSFFQTRRVQLAQLAARHAIPTGFTGRQYVEVGGLMSYGSDAREAFRQVGTYTGRILNGAKPSELPVVQASKFELVINAETARMLGITVPSSMLTAADEIIE
jgi:putative ABC transport system substrate-binding protein